MDSIFAQPVKLGDMTLANRLILAPLAGVSDQPFRRICQEHGAGLTFVEMLSAVAVLHSSRRTWDMMARHASEKNLGVQVTGRNADEVARAVAILDKEGYETIDINMGCPVRKVVGSGAGSGFLKEPQRISDTVAACRVATRRPLSVKCRIGFTAEEINVLDVASRVVQAGVDMLTIHGRVRSDDYAAPVQYPFIAAGLQRAREVASRPLLAVGNGNVMDRASGERMMRETRCDAVMISRGALGNPWIFQELLGQGDGHPTRDEWLDVVLRHMDYHAAFYGDTLQSVRCMRKHLAWYCYGFPHGNRLRSYCNTVESFAEARRVFREYAAGLPADLKRYTVVCADSGALPAELRDPKFEMDRELDRGVGHEGL